MCKTHETPSNATQAPAHAAEWAKQRFNKTATPGEADFSKLVDDGDLLGIPSLGAAGGSPKQDAPARSIIARASFIALSHFPAAFRRKKAVQRASIQLGALTSIESWVTLRDHYQFTAPAIRQHWSRSLVRLMPRGVVQQAA